MGLYNKYEEYNADILATRRTESLKRFMNANYSELEVRAIKIAAADTPTVKIENNKGFYSADCPNCGKIKILSSELKSMSAVCNKCYCAFNLEE